MNKQFVPKTTTGVVIAVALLAWTSVASAEGKWLLAKYDLNGDAKITEQEVIEKKINNFRLMDSDQDGRLSFSEYQEMDKTRRQLLLKTRFSKLDHDRDGVISDTEYSNFLGKFSSIDANGDGSLSSDEVQGRHPDNYVTRCLAWFCLRTPNNLE